MTQRPYRLAYLVTHPIQYQVPLLRLIAAQSDIELTVFFQSDISLREYKDVGFGQTVKWDVPLLEGYRHEFLPAFGDRSILTHHRPFSYGLGKRLRRGQFDALWVHGYARPVNWLAILTAKLRGLKVFIRDEATALSAPRSALKRLAKRWFFRTLAQFTDGFLAIGSANRDYYLLNGIPRDRVFLVPYAVDNAFFETRAEQASAHRQELRRQLDLEPGRPIILFASKFQVRKRPDDLLHAYRRLTATMEASAPPPYLLYVGGGELQPALEAEVKELGLTDVRFLGFRNQTELPALYDLCDVFILPSVREPWGLIVNEVMTAARPVIVTDEVGCASDLVKPGINGFTFPGGDIAALTQALQKILSDPARARAMGEASREIVKSWSFTEDLVGLRQALHATLGPLEEQTNSRADESPNRQH